jgi:branched-chain amino acid transport system ATP-binding protein
VTAPQENGMHGPDQPTALRAEGLTKSFGGVHAVRSVDLAVGIGERRALLGPNGAGKSTLFSLFTGELAPDGGRISIFGQDATRRSVRARARLGLGRTYQISQLFPQLTVEQSLFLAGSAGAGFAFRLWRGWRSHREQVAWAAEVADRVGLADRLGSPVRELSHGQQRQLELGMAMAMRPRLVMLDEPAAGLSPAERQMLVGLVLALPADVTLVLIEHDMDLVLQLAGRITVLHRGQVIADDEPAAVRASEDVQRVYLGEGHA